MYAISGNLLMASTVFLKTVLSSFEVPAVKKYACKNLLHVSVTKRMIIIS